jgi:hypothetical protein
VDRSFSFDRKPSLLTAGNPFLQAKVHQVQFISFALKFYQPVGTFQSQWICQHFGLVVLILRFHKICPAMDSTWFSRVQHVLVIRNQKEFRKFSQYSSCTNVVRLTHKWICQHFGLVVLILRFHKLCPAMDWTWFSRVQQVLVIRNQKEFQKFIQYISGTNVVPLTQKWICQHFGLVGLILRFHKISPAMDSTWFSRVQQVLVIRNQKEFRQFRKYSSCTNVVRLTHKWICQHFGLVVLIFRLQKIFAAND